MSVTPGKSFVNLTYASLNTESPVTLGSDTFIRLEIRHPGERADYIVWAWALPEDFSSSALRQSLERLDGNFALTVVSEGSPGYLGAPSIIVDAIVVAAEWMGAGAVGVAIDRLVSRIRRADLTSSDVASMEEVEHLARWMLATRYLRDHVEKYEVQVDLARRAVDLAVVTSFITDGNEVDFVVEIPGYRSAARWSLRTYAGNRIFSAGIMDNTATSTSHNLISVSVDPGWSELVSRARSIGGHNIRHLIESEISVERFMASLNLTGIEEHGHEVELRFDTDAREYWIECGRERHSGFAIGRVGWRAK